MSLFRKIIVATLIALLTTQSIFFAAPNQTEALFGVGDVVFDPTNTAQTTITAANTTVSSYSIFGINFKELSLDPIAYAIAKMVIRQITTDIVSWINSGFEGNPSFLSDPGGFFVNLIDEEVGKFIEGTELGFLCEPWSIDIRIALALRFTPFKKKVTCRLSEIIGNTEDAVEGFTRGNFTNGGWDAWISVTTDSSGNPYTSYIESSNELSIRIAGKDLVEARNLNFNNGFLSWKKCLQYEGQNGELQGAYETDAAREEAEASMAESWYENTSASGAKPRCTKEVVQTPGKVISDGLETTLGSPIRQLELADEFNEIINALVVQLLTQVFSGGNGLRGTSGSSNGTSVDTSSILYRLSQGEGENTNSGNIRTNTLQSIQTDLLSESAYYSEVNTTFLMVKEKYDALEATRLCFQDKLTEDRRPPLTPTQRATGEEKAAEADNLAQNVVAPHMATLTQKLIQSDTVIKDLQQLESALVAATTTVAISNAALDYNTIYASRRVHTPSDRVYIIEERDQLANTLRDIDTRTQALQAACNFFPNTSRSNQ